MKSIVSLKKRLSDNNILCVQNERGFIMEAEFEWNTPASDSDIFEYERNNNVSLPESYKEFLKISNGAILFKDKQYGQWGCKICGINELNIVNEKVRAIRGNFPDSWLVFATWLGDTDLLIFDLSKYNSGEKKYILDGDECDSEDEFDYINGDFEKWLDRLIVAQGSKYWRW